MTIPLRVIGIALLVLVLVWLTASGRGSEAGWVIPVGIALGCVLVWLFKYRPARARLALLHEGKHDEFHESNDKATAREVPAGDSPRY